MKNMTDPLVSRFINRNELKIELELNVREFSVLCKENAKLQREMQDLLDRRLEITQALGMIALDECLD